MEMTKDKTIDSIDELIDKADEIAEFENPLNLYLKSIAIGIRYLVEKS